MIFPNIRIFNIKEFDKYTKDSFSAINSWKSKEQKMKYWRSWLQWKGINTVTM